MAEFNYTDNEIKELIGISDSDDQFPWAKKISWEGKILTEIFEKNPTRIIQSGNYYWLPHRAHGRADCLCGDGRWDEFMGGNLEADILNQFEFYEKLQKSLTSERKPFSDAGGTDDEKIWTTYDNKYINWFADDNTRVISSQEAHEMYGDNAADVFVCIGSLNSDDQTWIEEELKYIVKMSSDWIFVKARIQDDGWNEEFINNMEATYNLEKVGETFWQTWTGGHFQDMSRLCWWWRKINT